MRDELRAKGGYLNLVHRRREHNTRADSYATLATMSGHGQPLPAGLVAWIPPRLHPYIHDVNPGVPPPLPAERSMDLRYSRAQIDDMFLEDLGIQVCGSARLLGAPIGDLLSTYADHFLRDRARHADSLMGKLYLLNNHRSEYLLLYYCSSAHRRFQPRVTPYNALGPYIEQATMSWISSWPVRCSSTRRRQGVASLYLSGMNSRSVRLRGGVGFPGARRRHLLHHV